LAQGQSGLSLGLLVIRLVLDLLVGRVGSNGLEDLFPQLGQIVGLDPGLDVLGKLLLESFLVFSVKGFHVFGNVLAGNVLLEDFGIELLFFLIVSNKSRRLVRDIETSIDGSFQSGKNSRSSGGSSQTNIEESLKGIGSIVQRGGNKVSVFVVFSLGDIFSSLVFVSQFEFGQGSSSEQETSGVSSRIVAETDGHSISRQFRRIGGGDDDVSSDLGVSQLANNSAVGKSNNESVFGGVVFVLVLGNQLSTSVVISLAFSSSSVFGLESLEVSLILSNFNESHDGEVFFSS
jgi:hypothetical protein